MVCKYSVFHNISKFIHINNLDFSIRMNDYVYKQIVKCVCIVVMYGFNNVAVPVDKVSVRVKDFADFYTVVDKIC